jgi:hypothetical protein
MGPRAGMDAEMATEKFLPLPGPELRSFYYFTVWTISDQILIIVLLIKLTEIKVK